MDFFPSLLRRIPIQRGSTYNNIYFHKTVEPLRHEEKKTKSYRLTHARTHLFHIPSYFPRDELNLLLPTKLNEKKTPLFLRTNVNFAWGQCVAVASEIVFYSVN